MSTNIYVCHHKAGSYLESDIFIPLHVGKSVSFNDIGCLGDDRGNNISHKNPFYCELTAHYWMWKNDLDSEYLGLMHYRRHFNFSSNQSFEEDRWGVIVAQEEFSEYQEKYGLDEDSVKKCLEGVDVVLPRRWSVRNAGSKNNYDHYRKSGDLFIADYQAAIDILLKQYPEYRDAVLEFNNSEYGFYTNMFVMRRAIFEEYSEWLFGIMEELEEHVSLQNYTLQQQRVFGHISERLFSIFILYKQRQSNIRVRELQRTFMDGVGFNGFIEPAFEEANHPLVICFDDNYAHSGGALISSIISHSDPKKNYDILILEDKVSEENKARLCSLTERCKNFSIRFFDVNTFGVLSGVHTRAHFSQATYARLFIPMIFRAQEKVLFIDADTIVNDDVAKLLDEDLGHCLIAAVKDIVMEGFVKFGTVSDADTGCIEAGKYLSEYLGLKDPGGYFQAGLIVFNLELMREEGVFAQLMEVLEEKPYWFLDQDIMNKVFQGRVKYLPMSWNVFHGNGNTKDFFPGLNFSTYSAFLSARMAPSMVHYAGDQKPWFNRSVDFSDLYWGALKNTPWYEEMCSEFIRNDVGSAPGVSDGPSAEQRVVTAEERFRKRIRPVVKRVFPVGSSRRKLGVNVYLLTLGFFRKFRFSAA
ncbi:DUF4422 domain-containing protein [Microbulbifer elongatus]|uniref:DUF4422 domain-containing protein n=1 Tax=Microbulbifer elongatus TaxID=86173 RepID=A0ABT1P6I3_9GAMM|nr:DUF4422 domain-containing protein [Microbulbifer elongatus]MCQ3830624.1 DUF4422 domain-containing protein [Microbulbifer elongatus]